jgi:3-hydroxybutyryl-CoA dehydrogenase
LGGATKHPERVVGIHFFNPAPVMPLVEVVRGDRTSDEVVAAAMDLARRWGKTPVQAKDSPGFIVNRVTCPFFLEALKLLGESVADVEAIDRIVRAGGFQMGPFELLDLIGLDVNFAVTQGIHNAFFQDPRYRPHPIQKRMVDAGMLGRKAGRGFYDYTHKPPGS